MKYPTILKCDIAGLPQEWIHIQVAAALYAREKVRWEAGEESVVLIGGRRNDGTQSTLRINSIIAVNDRSGKFSRVPPLTNRALFQRDGNICLYCGLKFPSSKLTREHYHAQSKGGEDSWTNCFTACRDCNEGASNRDVSEKPMPLALPFVPDRAAFLLLISSNRRILADQQAWLESFAAKNAKLS